MKKYDSEAHFKINLAFFNFDFFYFLQTPSSEIEAKNIIYQNYSWRESTKHTFRWVLKDK